MKLQVLILFLLISGLVNAQTYSDLIGKVYTRNEELNQFKKCVQNDARVDLERYICKYYLDTTRNKAIIIIEKENSDDTIYTYKIIDVVEWDGIEYDQLLIIGSNEMKEWKEQNTFVIAVECCIDRKKNEPWPIESNRIIKALTFNKSIGKLENLNVKKLYRIGEGYH